MKFKINSQIIDLDIQGEKIVGQNQNLLAKDDNLIANSSFSESGYGVFPFLSAQDYEAFKSGIENRIIKIIRKVFPDLPDDFALQEYHKLIGDQYEKHLKIIEQTKFFDVKEFPIDISKIENRISEICQVPLVIHNPRTGETPFHLRIIRPKVTDHNPTHRDVWQDENRDAVNIYVPIIGSNTLSSLIVIPGSHRWNESETERTRNGAIINNVKFNVPGLLRSKKDLKAVRPNPATNEVLVFTPYMLHGGAVNLNPDITRISLEVRFWRKRTNT